MEHFLVILPYTVQSNDYLGFTLSRYCRNSMDELKYSRAGGRMGLFLWTAKSTTEQLNIEHLIEEVLMTFLNWFGVWLWFLCCEAQRIANSSVTSHQIKPVLASVGSFKPWLIRASLSSDFCISLLYWIFAVSLLFKGSFDFFVTLSPPLWVSSCREVH